MRSSAQTLKTIKAKSAEWLRQGMSPRRLALTLALGFAIGCLPLLGLSTALCVIIALTFRLNQPAIQLANYAAMPLQVALLVPFVKLGGRLVSAIAGTAPSFDVFLHLSRMLPTHAASRFALEAGGMAGKAVLAWTLVAVPVVVVMTPVLTFLLQRVPVLAQPAEDKLV